MGIKEKRTKFLLSLLFLSDPVNLSFIVFTTTFQNLFDLPFNQKMRGIISGLLKEGLIEKKIEDKQIQEDLGEIGNEYRLTNFGYAFLCLHFPFFRYIKNEWDGKWRVISYEIPEKKRELRDKLRREMQGWGLGPWHRSFWITPHPIIESLRRLVSEKEEEQYIQAFESDHVFGNRETLIEKVWGIKKLEASYRELFKTWHDILSKDAGTNPQPLQGESLQKFNPKLEKFQKVISHYVNVLKTDPGLPKQLVGEKWIGFEAFSIFKEIRTILLT